MNLFSLWNSSNRRIRGSRHALGDSGWASTFIACSGPASGYEMQKYRVFVSKYRPRALALVLGMVLASGIALTAFAQAPANTPAISQPVTSPVADPAPAAPVDAAAPQVTDSATAGTPVIASASLPRDLSPWGMFLNADIVVKIVMVGLIFASLVTWTVWLAKNFELWKATRKGRTALAVLNEARSLSEANARLG